MRGPAARRERGRRRWPPGLGIVVRGAGHSVVWQAVGLGLGYAVHVALARWLGATGYGVYAYALGWAALLAVLAGQGVPLLLVRFVPVHQVREEGALLQGLLRWSAGRVMAVGVALAVGACAVVALLGPMRMGPYLPALYVGFALVPLQAALNVLAGAYQGLHRVGRSHALAAQRHALVLAGAAALVMLGPGLTGSAALGLTVAATGIVVGAQGRLLWRGLPEAVRQARPDFRAAAWRQVAGPLLLSSGFILILSQADVLMVGTLLGPRAAGLYRAAAKTAALVGILLVAAAAATGPMIAALYARGDHAGLRRLVAVVAQGLFWPSLGLAAGLALAAAPLLRLFGPDFAEAAPVLLWLVAGHLARAGAGVAATLLNTTGYERRAAAIYGVSAVLNVGLDAVGIALAGLAGAAVATALTLAGSGVAFAVAARRTLGLDPSIFGIFRKKVTGA